MMHFLPPRSSGRRGALALAAGALLACGVSCRGSLESSPDLAHDDDPAGASRDPAAPKVAEFDLTRGAPEVRPGGILRSAEGATFFDLVGALRRVEKEPDVKGVFVRFGGSRLGWARAGELAEALSGLRRAGRTVTCHADEWNNATFWAAARGCEKVWVSPAGGLETVGLAAELVFARELLAKLGVAVDVLQVGKYKGANETFTRDAASDEVRESLGGLLRDLRAAWARGLAEGRNQPDAARAAEDGPYAAERARALGLVDEVGYVDEARSALRKQLGAGRVEARFGGGASEGGRSGVVELVRVLSGAKRGAGGAGDHVAVVRAAGSIVTEGGGGLLGDDVVISARSLTKLLRRLGADEGVKAVVLRVDSPGGSALASDLLWHELMVLRKKKPLIVSVGDVAASGGYYLACAGSKVVAEEASVLGSIGVVGGKLAFGPALAPFGVHVETLTPSPAAPASSSAAPPSPPSPSARAAYASALTPWDDATRGRVLESMTAVYELFVRRVAEGRSLPPERVRAFAEGRVFGGREAKARGMVDELGGLGAALALARAEAKLPADAPARLVGDEPGLLDVFGLDDDDDRAGPAGAGAGLAARAAGWPGPWAFDDVAPFVRSLAPLLRPERALVAMPFALLVR